MKRSAILKGLIEGAKKELKDIVDVTGNNPGADSRGTGADGSTDRAADSKEEVKAPKSTPKKTRKQAKPATPKKKKTTATQSPKSKPQSLEESPAVAGHEEPAKDPVTPVSEDSFAISAQSLGSDEFKKDYNLRYAYISGSMVRGIASKEIVVAMAKSGMMGFFGSGGLSLDEIEKNIRAIGAELGDDLPFGMNMLHNPHDPGSEEEIVDLYLKYKVRVVEASAYLLVTPALVKYRAKGLKKDETGNIVISNKVIAKVSRPEVATAFLSPAPRQVVEKLLAAGKITPQEARLLEEIAMADDLCIEADSGGHTDAAVALVVFPSMVRLRDEMVAKYGYPKKARIGAAGGIGSPEAAAAYFMMGADFILTGSINQCTVEAGISEAVKDLLQQVNVQDTDYAPAGDMFELGSKVQVLKKGVFFPARANKLYDLYRHCDSIDAIDPKTRTQIEQKYFKKTFQEVYEECKVYFDSLGTNDIERAEKNPKIKMALIFRWYFYYSTMLALQGDKGGKVDYQVHCGPALGAFNQWVKGSELEDWRNRHVDQIAIKLMNETAQVLGQRYRAMTKK